MPKTIKITQHGSQFTMLVELESGHKERWTYQREETNIGVNYVMIDREDA
jgi:hypothetical protein